MIRTDDIIDEREAGAALAVAALPAGRATETGNKAGEAMVNEHNQKQPAQDPLARFSPFLTLVTSRLARGATEIGEAERPRGDPRTVGDLVRNIDEELADLVAWGAVLSAKLHALHDQINDLPIATAALVDMMRASHRLRLIGQILDTEQDTGAACADIARVLRETA